MDQCIAVGSLLTEIPGIYVVSVYHLNTGIEEPININIKPEKYVIITIIRIIINYLIFKIIQLNIVHQNLL